MSSGQGQYTLPQVKLIKLHHQEDQEDQDQDDDQEHDDDQDHDRDPDVYHYDERPAVEQLWLWVELGVPDAGPILSRLSGSIIPPEMDGTGERPLPQAAWQEEEEGCIWNIWGFFGTFGKSSVFPTSIIPGEMDASGSLASRP